MKFFSDRIKKKKPKQLIGTSRKDSNQKDDLSLGIPTEYDAAPYVDADSFEIVPDPKTAELMFKFSTERNGTNSSKSTDASDPIELKLLEKEVQRLEAQLQEMTEMRDRLQQQNNDKSSFV